MHEVVLCIQDVMIVTSVTTVRVERCDFMSLIPNTVCQRCHRKYPAVRSSCPYCGTKKAQTVRRSVPESDSAVRGTDAARRSRENVNFQMLISGILLVCIIAAVTTIVSVNMSSRVDSPSRIRGDVADNTLPDTTPVPSSTPEPSPTPEPTPPVTKLELYYQDSLRDQFAAPHGAEVQLECRPYPLNNEVEIQWYSTDESVATVDQTGLVTMTGEVYDSCDIAAKAPNGVEVKCKVFVNFG